MANGAISPQQFVGEFRKLAPGFCQQLRNTSSSVVKEATTTLVAIAEAFQEAFTPAVAQLLDALFAALSSTSKIVQNEISRAIMAVLTHCPSSRHVPKILGLYQNRNPNIRLRAAEYIGYIIANSHKYFLQSDEHQQKIEQVVRQGLEDPTP